MNCLFSAVCCLTPCWFYFFSNKLEKTFTTIFIEFYILNLVLFIHSRWPNRSMTERWEKVHQKTIFNFVNVCVFLSLYYFTLNYYKKTHSHTLTHLSQIWRQRTHKTFARRHIVATGRLRGTQLIVIILSLTRNFSIV